MLLAFSLQLPTASPPAPETGKPVPAQAAKAEARAPWEAAWSRSLGTSDDLLLAVSRDHVFTASAGTSLVAREADTGDVAWTHDARGWRALGATSTMVVGVAGNHAYGLEASTGQTRWVTETTGPDQHLVLAGDRLLMVSENDAIIRDVVTGSPLGRIGIDGPTAARAVSPEATVLAFADGRLASFDVAAGLRLWQTTLRRPPAAIAAADDSIYLAMPDGTLQAVNARNGSVRWSFPLRVPIVGEPFASERFVHVVLLDNSLRTFDRRSGAMLRTDGLGHRPAAGPWVTGSSAVIGLTTGEFLVLDPETGRVETRLAVPDGERLRMVPVEQISMLVAQGNYVELVMPGLSLLLRETLAALVARLDPARFVRIHRSRAVRIDLIDQVESYGAGQYWLRLKNGACLASGRAYRQAVRDALGLQA